MDNNLLRKIRVRSLAWCLSFTTRRYLLCWSQWYCLVDQQSSMYMHNTLVSVYTCWKKLKKIIPPTFIFLFHSSFSKKNYSLSYNSFALLFRLLRDLAEGRSLSRVCFFTYEKSFIISVCWWSKVKSEFSVENLNAI